MLGLIMTLISIATILLFVVLVLLTPIMNGRIRDDILKRYYRNPYDMDEYDVNDYE